VFDACGTLFDVNSALRNAEDSSRDKWQPLAELWRPKQLQYTWLRGFTGRHAGERFSPFHVDGKQSTSWLCLVKKAISFFPN